VRQSGPRPDRPHAGPRPDRPHGRYKKITDKEIFFPTEDKKYKGMIKT